MTVRTNGPDLDWNKDSSPTRQLTNTVETYTVEIEDSSPTLLKTVYLHIFSILIGPWLQNVIDDYKELYY